MLYCASCGAQIADDTAVCPACGKSVGKTSLGVAAASTPAQAPATTGSGLSDNVAGMLAYVTIIPAILFLVIEPYNKRRFVRFHAFQCIFFALACIAASFALRIIAFMPVVRWSTLLLWPLLGMAEFIIWVICLFKAYQGQMFRLPVIGELAEQQAFTVPDDTNQAKAA
jgi:uncharacterized membrane protein